MHVTPQSSTCYEFGVCISTPVVSWVQLLSELNIPHQANAFHDYYVTSADDVLCDHI